MGDLGDKLGSGRTTAVLKTDPATDLSLSLTHAHTHIGFAGALFRKSAIPPPLSMTHFFARWASLVNPGALEEKAGAFHAST